MSPKTGRPKEENPNVISLTVRINEQLNTKLLKFCDENQLTKGEVVRKGLEIILDEKK